MPLNYSSWFALAERDSHWVPVLLILYNIAANLSNDMYLPSMSVLDKVFGTTAHGIQLTMTAWLLGVALPQFLWGFLSDIWGRRPILLSGGVCFLLGTLACILAPRLWVLMAGRFLQGAGVCSLNVTSLSIVNELYDCPKRIRIMALISLGGSLAPIAGPVLGGYLFAWLGWQANFVAVGLLALFTIVGLWLKLPESQPCLQLPMVPRQLWQGYKALSLNREFIGNVILYSAMMGGLFVYLTGSPFILINQLHQKPQTYGLLQLWVFGAGAVGALMVTLLVNHVSAKKLLQLGLSLVLLASLWLTFNSLLWSESVSAFIAPIMLYMLGFSLSGSLLVSSLMSAAAAMRGLAAAYLGCISAIAGAITSYLTSLLYNNTTVSIAVILMMVILLAYLSVLLLRKRLLPTL